MVKSQLYARMQYKTIALKRKSASVSENALYVLFLASSMLLHTNRCSFFIEPRTFYILYYIFIFQYIIKIFNLIHLITMLNGIVEWNIIYSIVLHLLFALNVIEKENFIDIYILLLRLE